MAGKGNYPGREAKKTKKGARKTKGVGGILPPPTVTVIKRERNPAPVIEEEERGEEQ